MATRKKTSQSASITTGRKDITVKPDNVAGSIRVEEAQAEYGRTVTNRAIVLLGMKGNKGGSTITNIADFISVIRKGVSKKALYTLMEMTGITSKEMAFIIRLSDRTLRRYKSQTLLNPEQSERIIELARLYSRGEQVFGNLESFKEWMNSTVMALGNRKPKEFLDTSLGIGILMDELGRIEHGIFA
jgi:putative toxin-antitoxin system antitoxin component (TIGR02293 family)